MKKLLLNLWVLLLGSLSLQAQGLDIPSTFVYEKGMEWFYHREWQNGSYQHPDSIDLRISYNHFIVDSVEPTDLGEKATILVTEYNEFGKVKLQEKFYIYRKDDKLWTQQEGENKPLTLFHDPTMRVGDWRSTVLMQEQEGHPRQVGFPTDFMLILVKSSLVGFYQNDPVKRYEYEVRKKDVPQSTANSGYAFNLRIGGDDGHVSDLLDIRNTQWRDDIVFSLPSYGFPGFIDAFLRVFRKNGEVVYENPLWKKHFLHDGGASAVFAKKVSLAVEDIEPVATPITYDKERGQIEKENAVLFVYALDGSILAQGRDAVSVAGVHSPTVIVCTQEIGSGRTNSQKLIL